MTARTVLMPRTLAVVPSGKVAEQLARQRHSRGKVPHRCASRFASAVLTSKTVIRSGGSTAGATDVLWEICGQSDRRRQPYHSPS
jgi:hypothetical protein